MKRTKRVKTKQPPTAPPLRALFTTPAGSDIQNLSSARLVTREQLAYRVLLQFYRLLNGNDAFRRDLGELCRRYKKDLVAGHPPQHVRAELDRVAERWSLPHGRGNAHGMADLWHSLRHGVKATRGSPRLVPVLGGLPGRRSFFSPSDHTLRIELEFDLRLGTCSGQATNEDEQVDLQFATKEQAFKAIGRLIVDGQARCSSQNLRRLPLLYRDPKRFREFAEIIYQACVLKQPPTEIARQLQPKRDPRWVRTVLKRWCPLLGMPCPIFPRGGARRTKRTLTQSQ